MRRLLLLPLLLVVLVAAAPFAGAAEPEEANESALVKEALEGR